MASNNDRDASQLPPRILVVLFPKQNQCFRGGCVLFSAVYIDYGACCCLTEMNFSAFISGGKGKKQCACEQMNTDKMSRGKVLPL